MYHLNVSVCLTIGAYSKWLDAASSGLSILPLVIDILLSGMGTSEDSAAAASLAFRHLCDGMLLLPLSGSLMLGFMSQLYTILSLSLSLSLDCILHCLLPT